MREIPIVAEGPRILGVHLEGPFLARTPSAHTPSPARRDPDLELLERLLDAGPVRLMTLAPELPGALELIDLLLARGVTVSCGHTDATAEQADAAFDRGVGTVTHLFNAMRPFRHRDPGIAGAALARDDVVVQIILDGIHLAPDTVRLVWRAAAGRVALVTDAMAGAGVRRRRLQPRQASRSTSATASRAARRRARRQRADDDRRRPEPACARRPARGRGRRRDGRARRVLGLADVGRLDVGMPADVVVLDDNLEIERVLVGGEARVVCLRPAPSSPRGSSEASSSPRSASSPARSKACSSTRDEFARVAAACATAAPTLVRMVGHGSSDNAASYGVYAFGLLPGWTALRDSISLTVYYGAKVDLRGSTRHRPLAVRGARRTSSSTSRAPAGRGVHGRDHERPRSRRLRGAAEAVLPLDAGPERAVAATKTYIEPDCGARAARRHAAGEGAALGLARRDPRRGSTASKVMPGARAARARGGAAVRLRRAHVRDRPRPRSSRPRARSRSSCSRPAASPPSR